MQRINNTRLQLNIINQYQMKLNLPGKAESSLYNSYEDIGITGHVCQTCHCPYGTLIKCTCGNILCEACEKWSTGKLRTLAFNKNKKTKKRQRYILEYLPSDTRNCNKCNKVIGYRL